RIRHKLVLGLCLFVGILGLVLAGTCYGLNACAAAIKTMGSKADELKEAENLSAEVLQLAAPADPKESRSEQQILENRLTRSITALQAYKAKLNETVQKGRDPQRGFNEQQQVAALEKWFDKLAN